MDALKKAQNSLWRELLHRLAKTVHMFSSNRPGVQQTVAECVNLSVWTT